MHHNRDGSYILVILAAVGITGFAGKKPVAQAGTENVAPVQTRSQ